MIKKCSLTKQILCGLTLSLLVGGNAFAANQKYTSYRLESWGENNHTNTHDKETQLDAIINRVKAISCATKGKTISFVNFWAENADGDDISPKYKQNVSPNATTIKFKSGVNLSINDQVRMAMENADFNNTTGAVSGEVDFQ